MATVNWSLQHKRDTAANWTSNNPTLLVGQLGIETDGLTTTPKFKIGDGVTAWNTLPYFYGGSASAQNLNNVLSVGNSTGGQDMTITADDNIKFGTGNAVIFNDSNIIDPSHVIIASNPSYTGHTHLMVKDGANEWHDESADAFTSIMVGSVPNNAIQLDAANDKINIFSGASGLNLQNDTYLNSVTASRLLSTDSNKKIAPLTGTGFLKLTGGIISYDTNTYLTSISGLNISLLNNDSGYITSSALSPYLTSAAAALAYQPLDSDLTSWASVTRASGFDTFTATPSSANLSSLLTDKTGTGVNVFGTSPTFTTDITTPKINGVSGNLLLTNAAQTSGAITNFTFTNSSNTGQTASTEISNFKVNGASKTWAAGAITTQRWNYFTANTAAFASASTITNSYGLYVEAATAGSNATITNNWAAGFSGNIYIDGTTGSSIFNNSAGSNILRIQRLSGTVETVVSSTSTGSFLGSSTAHPTAIQSSGVTRISFSGSGTGDCTVTDAVNFILGSTTGHKFGTATTQKIGFWNATPIVQPANTTNIDDVLINTGLWASGATYATFTKQLSTRIAKRITTITSSATPTINTDNCDAVTITALAANITSFTTNLSGTPNNFDELTIRIKDDGTARTLAWGASFEAKGVALPTTTVISKVLTVKFIYDSVTSKWGCVASVSEY